MVFYFEPRRCMFEKNNHWVSCILYAMDIFFEPHHGKFEKNYHYTRITYGV